MIINIDVFNFLIQASEQKIAMEMNVIGEADVKVDFEEFCDANDDQANYDDEITSFYDEVDVKDEPIFP